MFVIIFFLKLKAPNFSLIFFHNTVPSLCFGISSSNNFLNSEDGKSSVFILHFQLLPSVDRVYSSFCLTFPNAVNPCRRLLLFCHHNVVKSGVLHPTLHCTFISILSIKSVFILMPLRYRIAIATSFLSA